ncbi:MAG: glutathione S-transferase [Rhodospirillaceae bacterium]|nr:glutathione S-transferase [Rhodospirillaceae bacterium]MBL25378.1 glutathione S-transferase [Rhodospirillaceae bacterium]HAA93953.1 DUF952 domain-containing protein [Rhodospirillaceae bacterium]|tara:strand:- start:82 stop:423 length:342 start_codon:yes stop_codon:yes gene_type:complete
MPTIYHLAREADWKSALRSRRYEGGLADKNDGFLHFSSAEEIETSAELYCKGLADLLLIAVEAESLGDNLKWEMSRDNKAFPHLYGVLDPAHALWAKPLPLDADGNHIFPPLD